MRIFQVLCLLALCASGAFAQPMELTPSQKLRAAEGLIESFYVEDVDADALTAEAIRAMLHDP